MRATKSSPVKSRKRIAHVPDAAPVHFRTERPVGDIIDDLARYGILDAATAALGPSGVLLVAALSRSRSPSIVRARHRVVRALALLVDGIDTSAWRFSYLELGKLLGLDHTTVMSVTRRPIRPPVGPEVMRAGTQRMCATMATVHLPLPEAV